ncbi:PapI protein [Escherichia coli]|nr:PapI protein [Escherichia coli]MDI4314589.1 PapI protein [Escherichia coli]QKI56921.1 PapI protein [Escherichia coli]RXA35109.1 PapI protein [Escherichia coli]TFO12602.1 PapI protein [Escherichia coli]
MLPSETMIWQPEFTDKTLSRKPGAVQVASPGCHCGDASCSGRTVADAM